MDYDPFRLHIPLMATYEELKTAILETLRAIGATPGVPISLYNIGVPLVRQGYAEGEIVNALLAMEGEKIILPIKNNSLRLASPLD